jgi:hypothetical protein
MRCVDAGLFANVAAGRTGRRTNSPPQLGHWPFNTFSAQRTHQVHSNEQIMAFASGGRSTSQHSQLGRSSSMAHLLHLLMAVA